MILEETINLLKSRYKKEIDNLTISDLRIGLHITAVILSDDSCGVASTLIDNEHICMKRNRQFDEFTPTKIIGEKVKDLLETTQKSTIIDTLKIAVLNAISSKILLSSNYKVVKDLDPIDLIDLSKSQTITIVGAFHSYIKKIIKTNNKLYVFELDKNNLHDEYHKYYVPAIDYKNILPKSDVVIITGLTLINNTIDGLLEAIKPGTQVIVTGPSSSLIPDILFKNKVDAIGATQVTNPELLLSIAGEAARVFHLFKYCANKICILKK